MTNNFHDLITRMANELDEYRRLLLDDCTVTHRLSNEARAALAKADGPAVPEGREPAAVTEQRSDEEIMGLMPQQMHEDLAYAARAMANEAGTDNRKAKGFMRIALNRHAVDLARAVLARWGNPAPLPPAEGEVAELVAELRDAAFDLNGSDPAKSMLTRAADLLERQATACAICERERLHQSTRAADMEVERQAAPVPVPVNERLPGPEDCDAEGRCWWGRDESDDWYADWTLATHKAVAEFCGFSPQTVWIPAHALPLPEVGE